MVVRCAFSPPPPPNGIPPQIQGPEASTRGLEDPHDRRAAPRIVRRLAPHQRMERRLSRRACTERYTDTWGVWCVCVCGVCVCMAKGKTILFHRGRGGAGSPSSLARTHSWKTTKPQGWGEGMPQEAEHKTAAVGEGDAAEAEGYPVPQGGGGENTP